MSDAWACFIYSHNIISSYDLALFDIQLMQYKIFRALRSKVRYGILYVIFLNLITVGLCGWGMFVDPHTEVCMGKDYILYTLTSV